ncbi:hypothetical protein PQX77_015271 [Marasmius sp. AFHP31]|nr:hypothetical protein PQX77_015271 [Marasmius sp. AFHP31]
MSKYRRSNPSMFAMNHVVYVPKVPDSFKNKYKDLMGRAATEEVFRFVKRELIQLVWALIISDPGFVEAYLHGKLERCADGIIRLLFPRLFAHSADYVEKVLLASIKFLSEYPCPQCLIKKSQIHQLGMKWDHRRRDEKRVDSVERRERIEDARSCIFQHGMALKSDFVVDIMEGGHSEQLDRNTFSELLHQVGDNYYNLLVADTMHELAGLMESIFKQLNRLIFAENKKNLDILNDRYRKVTTFDNGTIRRFVNNVTLMKKFAFRDFEDVIQCSIPCFEGLLPDEHNDVILDLLWDFNVLIAYASLGIHTDSTVASLDSTITEYGKSLRVFVNTTCAFYTTTEIPEEAEKRRNAAASRAEKKLKQGKAPKKKKKSNDSEEDADGLKEKTFNMKTFKTHMPTHYPYFIKAFGSLDSYTTRMGEREHIRTKRLYGRTNKHNHEPQMAIHHRRARLLHSLRVKGRFAEHHKANATVYTIPDRERLPRGNPKERYQMSPSERYPLKLHEFTSDDKDPTLIYFYDHLRSHLLYRMLELSGDEELNRRQLNSVIFVKNRIYIHRTFRIHYNTYNLRRKAQTINPRTHPDIMLLADDVTREEEQHPYRYARVVGIFHANVWIWDDKIMPEHQEVKKMDFLWVRWYELDTTYRHGWTAKRMPKVRFLPASDPEAFGFVDPSRVIRGGYLEPAFHDGLTADYDEETAARMDLLPPESVARVHECICEGELVAEAYDWNAYYVNLFGDRDLFMRQRGGGVGHSTRSFTRQLEREATKNDKPLPTYDLETGELLEDVPGWETEEENGDEDDEDMVSEAESSDESTASSRSTVQYLGDYDSNDDQEVADEDDGAA